MIVFLHVPKTAGSTFQFILENTFGINACHTNHTKRSVFRQGDFNFARKVYPFMRSLAGHNLVDPLSLSIPNPYYTTFLREPVARLISQYVDSVLLEGNRLSFEDSLRTLDSFENIHVKLMAGGRNLDRAKLFLDKCGFVGLTERFDLSLAILERVCPVRLNLRYFRRRTTPPSPLKEGLESDSRLMDMAREYNKLDIELYSYALREIFPRLAAKAGFKPDERVPARKMYHREMQFGMSASSLYGQLVYRQLCKRRRHDGPLELAQTPYSGQLNQWREEAPRRSTPPPSS